MTTTVAFVSRQERFPVVGSTNDVVRGWLAEGTPEVCLAVADEQSAGRGRLGRTWIAPAGSALLLSLGFRPRYLAPDRLWRLPAVVSLAMADAAEAVAGLRDGTIRLKWPNDLVVEASALGPDPGALFGPAGEPPEAEAGDGPAGGVRKLGGVLGESAGIGSDDVRTIVGIGVNADWPHERFPVELAGSMTSLSEASGGRPFELDDLLQAFLLRLEPRVQALREGLFDVAGWHERQATTGRLVTLGAPEAGGATRTELVRAVGVDGASGALLVEDPARPGTERAVLVGEVVAVRVEDDGVTR